MPLLSLPDDPVTSDQSEGLAIVDSRRAITVYRLSSNAALRTPIGAPFHPNVAALAESSRSCTLCSVIHIGVTKWLSAWKDNTIFDKVFDEIQQKRFLLPLDEPLMLTRCWSGHREFLVWTRTPKSDAFVYLLAAVTFGVKRVSMY